MIKKETQTGNILLVALIGIVIALGTFLIAFMTTQRADEDLMDPKIKNLKIPPIEIPKRASLVPLVRPSLTPEPTSVASPAPATSPQPPSSP